VKEVKQMNAVQKHKNHILTLLALACLVAGCAGASISGNAPHVWIDAPVNGLSVPADQYVNIEGHATYGDGIARVEVWANGELHHVVENPPAKGSLAHFEQAWMPPGPGEYTVQVIAIAPDGAASAPDSVVLHVGGAVAKVPTGTPTPVPTDGPTATPTPVPTGVLPTDVPTSVPTDVPTSVPTDVPTAVPQIDFWADDEGVEAGSCTTIHWRVQNVQAVFLDGNGVAGEGSHQTCPCEEETHTLTVTLLDGSQTSRSLTIRVKGSCVTPTPTTKPPDITPPPVPETYVPAEGLVLDCRSSQDLAWLPVQDDGGGPVKYDVELQYELKVNQWESAHTWKSVTGKSVTAGGDEGIDCGRKFRWRVRAYDGAGNYSAWSAWSRFSISMD
jgi:hypothetical protein